MRLVLSFILASMTSYIFCQELTLTQTVSYINKKLLENEKIYSDELAGFSSGYKICNKIQFSSDGYLIIESKSESMGMHYENISPVFLIKKYKILVYGCTFYTGNNGEGINFSGKIKYSTSSDIEPYISTPSCYLCFSNENDIQESMINAFTHLFKLVNENPNMTPKKDENDPFASKNIETKPKQISTGNSTNVIRMENISGVYTIPVVLNGVLKINFIFDSGATDVSISPDVALTLIRTGTVGTYDFVGDQKYYFADGSSATSKVFYLKELTIGNQTVYDIRASISNSIDAPMLLGQSVMQKFGKITIDNNAGTLTIEK